MRRFFLMQPQAAPPKPPPPPPVMVDEKYGKVEEIMSLPVPKLVAILKDANASVYAKAKTCQRLAVVGDKSAVPALAALLAHPELSTYARYGLEPNPDASADEALRAALGKLKGRQLAGVINSIARRKDLKALDALGKLRYDADAEVAKAAEAALAVVRPAL